MKLETYKQNNSFFSFVHFDCLCNLFFMLICKNTSKVIKSKILFFVFLFYLFIQ
jgi:hypothetical protein